MQIKLDLNEFPVLPGSQYVDLWNLYYLEEEEGVIKYGWQFWSSLRCAESSPNGFLENKEKTKEIFPVLLEKLASEAANLANVDYGGEIDKISKIKYIRQKYALGLKEARDLVEEGGLPPKLKAWKLPYINYIPTTIPNKEEDNLVYIENKGVYPLFNVLQNKHLAYILEWQPELTKEKITPEEFYLFTDGDIMGIAPEAEFFWSKYTTNFKVCSDDYVPGEGLVGKYPTLELARSHYAVFEMAESMTSRKWRSRLSRFVEEYTPQFGFIDN